MKLYVKNMVCLRCEMIVKSELEQLGVKCMVVTPGEIYLLDELTKEQLRALETGIGRSGLELISERKNLLIEKIKNVIIESVHYTDELINIKFSEYLSRKLNYDYTYLANLFSEVVGITIEKFIIKHKIEKVKEMLVYDERTLTEIAQIMNYSSPAHLSRQFKQVTGESPVLYKRIRHKRKEMMSR